MPCSLFLLSLPLSGGFVKLISKHKTTNDQNTLFYLRTDLDNEYIAVIGADNWVKYRFGASALSNTQMAFNNIKPAGEKFMINTRWYIEYKTRIILTADNAGEGETKLLNKGKFGFRPWPLQSCVTNTLLRLNNKTSTPESRTGCML